VDFGVLCEVHRAVGDIKAHSLEEAASDSCARSHSLCACRIDGYPYFEWVLVLSGFECKTGVGGCLLSDGLGGKYCVNDVKEL
jgi:hypothetical protein